MPSEASAPIATVLGGTGFLGRRIVRHLHEHGFAVRIGSRHVSASQRLFGTQDARLQPLAADIHDEASLNAAFAGARAAVNAVSLYVERGGETFRSVHVEGARRVAEAARRAGVAQLVHLSGIGADPQSASPYIRSRGEGEAAVRAAFPEAILVRPAVMFGPDDAFLTVMLGLLRRLRVYPLFGSGRTRLQPVHVEDMAEAIARALQRAEPGPLTFEFGGPRVYTYEELLRGIAREAGIRAVLIPVPFAVWHALAQAAELLPRPPLARNQVELMQLDTVASPTLPGFATLGMAPSAIEDLVRTIARAG